MAGDTVTKRRRSQHTGRADYGDGEAGTREDRRREERGPERKPLFTEGFLLTAAIILGLLVIISSYWLGYQYGRLSLLEPMSSTPTPVQMATVPAPTQAAQPNPPPPPSVPRTMKPKVELFVMSYCPFGLQMEKAFVQVEELLAGKANFEVKFVNYIMHGEKEVIDNTRMHCIQKEQPSTWIAFEKCFVQTTDYEQCARQAGVDTAKVDSCYAATDAAYGLTAAWEDQASWLSGRYARYPLHDAENEAYGVQGSPTLVINGQQVSIGRSAEAVKQAVCNAFTTPPAECQRTLNVNQEQPGAGPLGAGTSPTAAVGNCG